MKITTEQLKNIFFKISDVIKINEDLLTDLDQKIGDGDHGFNMVRGFNKINLLLTETVLEKPSDVFSFVGKTLLSTVGGASGPLYGMAFIKASLAFKDEKELTFEKFKEFVKSASQIIASLGKATLNEKTMLDVWVPFSNYLQNLDSLDEKNKTELLELLKNLTNTTKNMEATKGRASFIGKRSIGNIDPGSFSSFLILSEFIRNF